MSASDGEALVGHLHSSLFALGPCRAHESYTPYWQHANRLAILPAWPLQGLEHSYLEMVRRNRQTYLATVGVEGFGHDPQLEAIVEEARERSADEVIGLLRPGEDPTEAPRELRALVRAYAGFVESATLQWLQRRTLTREQVEEKGLLKSLFIPGIEVKS